MQDKHELRGDDCRAHLSSKSTTFKKGLSKIMWWLRLAPAGPGGGKASELHRSFPDVPARTCMGAHLNQLGSTSDDCMDRQGRWVMICQERTMINQGMKIKSTEAGLPSNTWWVMRCKHPGRHVQGLRGPKASPRPLSVTSHKVSVTYCASQQAVEMLRLNATARAMQDHCCCHGWKK